MNSGLYLYKTSQQAMEESWYPLVYRLIVEKNVSAELNKIIFYQKVKHIDAVLGYFLRWSTFDQVGGVMQNN